MKTTVECSRCHKSVDGLIEEKYTGGFYNVKEPSSWAKFANKDEEVICDNCMHNDYRYRSVYNGELLISVNDFLEEMVGWGEIRFSKEGKNWRIEVLDINGHIAEIVADVLGTTKEYAVNEAYLMYLRNRF